ncbi:MAG: SIR2 family NAD-dependent protein deacylase [Myxococcota bacterium]
MTPLRLTDDTHVLVLTGAGISAESGIPTFRGANGLWENQPVERVASVEGFVQDPGLVWRFYSERHAAAKHVEPNSGHRALAELERRLGDRLLLVTQNIDGLHQAAGSSRVVELHGSLWKSRCSRCDREPFADDALHEPTRLPACGRCNARGEFALLRPHIVWFGERLAPDDLARIDHFVERAHRHHFVFLAVGTSGAVAPASQLVERTRSLGAETWLVNAEPPLNVASFEHVILGASGAVLPTLLG